MALNGQDLGDQITDDVLAAAGADLNAGEKTTVRTFWRLITTDITNHFDTEADVLPGTFEVLGNPVTGIGEID